MEIIGQLSQFDLIYSLGIMVLLILLIGGRIVKHKFIAKHDGKFERLFSDIVLAMLFPIITTLVLINPINKIEDALSFEKFSQLLNNPDPSLLKDLVAELQWLIASLYLNVSLIYVLLIIGFVWMIMAVIWLAKRDEPKNNIDKEVGEKAKSTVQSAK